MDPRAQVRRFGRVVVDVEKAIADEEALFESIALWKRTSYKHELLEENKIKQMFAYAAPKRTSFTKTLVYLLPIIFVMMVCVGSFWALVRFLPN